MKIIVTGGLGFIGSNIVNFLNKKGINDILIVDNFNINSKFKNILDCQYNDLISISEFEIGMSNNFFKEYDIIIHQGACSDTMEVDGQYVFKNNYTYSRKLLEFCLYNNIRLIYASSAAVYGNSKKFKEIVQNEKPINIYGFSKLCFDNYVRSKIPHNNTQIAGLRYFNVYGPKENLKGRMSSIIYQLFRQQQENKQMYLFGETKNYSAGKQERDFIYIDDILNFNWFLINNPSVSGIFNAGTGEANTFFHVANSIFEALTNNKNNNTRNIEEKQKPNIKFIKFPDKLIGKYQEHTKADINAIRKHGFNYHFPSISDSIKKYINYLLIKNEDDI
jgi:ADP-L-glycero-D-manno-heptose 6-epimerase